MKFEVFMTIFANLDFGNVNATQHESVFFCQTNVVVKSPFCGRSLPAGKDMKMKKSSSHAAWEWRTRSGGYNNNYT